MICNCISVCVCVCVCVIFYFEHGIPVTRHTAPDTTRQRNASGIVFDCECDTRTRTLLLVRHNTKEWRNIDESGNITMEWIFHFLSAAYDDFVFLQLTLELVVRSSWHHLLLYCCQRRRGWKCQVMTYFEQYDLITLTPSMKLCRPLALILWQESLHKVPKAIPASSMWPLGKTIISCVSLCVWPCVLPRMLCESILALPSKPACVLCVCRPANHENHSNALRTEYRKPKTHIQIIKV